MAETLVVTLTLLGVIVGLVYKYLTWYFDTWTKVGLAGPRPTLLYGNFPSALTGKRHIIYDIENVYNQYKKDNLGAIGVFRLHKPELLLLDPKVARDTTVSNFRRFHDNLASKLAGSLKVDKYASRNPFFTVGEHWKIKRAEGIGGLTPNKLQSAYPIWKECAKKLGIYLKDVTIRQSNILETKDLAYRFTATVMGDFLFGIDAGTLVFGDTRPNKFYSMAKKWLEGASEAEGTYFALELVPLIRKLVYKRFYPEISDKYFANIIKEAITMRKQNEQAANRLDFLNYILQLQEKKDLGYDDVVGHILTVMLDGYETSGTVLAHTLFYLAKYQDVQDKLRVEILENLDSDGFLTYENLTVLPYLDQCVQETLRMITPLPILTRICTEYTELEIGNDKKIPIKPGMLVKIPVFCYHHDPEYFPHPYTYNPDRFDNEANVELTKQGIFMPFGNGPRICLGMRVGLLEIKTCLVQIISEYRVKNCSKTMEDKKPDGTGFIFGLKGEFWLEYEHL